MVKIEKNKKLTGLDIPVYNLKGEETKTIALPKEIFSCEAKPALLAQAVRVYLTNQRQGNASTKTRGEVTGSTRKIYRQKGTGKARHGDIKAPIFVGGGIVGGPRPKNYSLSITKGQKSKAFFGALSLKLKEKKIIVLEDKVLMTKPKTKEIFSFLESIKQSNKRVIFILPKMEKSNFILSSRNIKKANIVDAKSLTTYEVLKEGVLIFLESSLEIFKKHFLKHEN
jgi:large subunit ribosomal protein L4